MAVGEKKGSFAAIERGLVNGRCAQRIVVQRHGKRLVKAIHCQDGAPGFFQPSLIIDNIADGSDQNTEKNDEKEFTSCGHALLKLARPDLVDNRDGEERGLVVAHSAHAAHSS